MSTTRATGFDPSTHGFHFRNHFSGVDILNETIGGVGDVAERMGGSQEFWEGWGLCGGMVWHALDRFYAEEAVPPLSQTPDRDSALFRVLITRQFDSFRGSSLLRQCLKWQTRSDSRRRWDPRTTNHALTLKAWDELKESVDRGHPASLCLIRTATSPWENHQVLAVGYDDAPGLGVGEVGLYDPNHPDRQPTIRITLGGPEAGRAIQSSGERLRGLFVWPYDGKQRSAPVVTDSTR